MEVSRHVEPRANGPNARTGDGYWLVSWLWFLGALQSEGGVKGWLVLRGRVFARRWLPAWGIVFLCHRLRAEPTEDRAGQRRGDARRQAGGRGQRDAHARRRRPAGLGETDAEGKFTLATFEPGDGARSENTT